MARRIILSIDGGGLRGIIPVSLLVALERSTGRPSRESFHFVAGTSTGAIIAAGIAAGVPAKDMLDFYVADAAAVFTQRPWNLLKRLALGWMYDPKRLKAVLGKRLGAARAWRLNDAPVDLLLTAKRLSDGMPWYFVRNNPRNSGRTGRLGLADCVVASTSEPTYFRPWTMPEDRASLKPGEDPVGTLVGGGVGVAGNPVYQACVEAFYYAEGYDPEQTMVISLGTGRYTARARPTWIWPWLQWVLSELLRSPGEQQTELVQRHFPQTLFYRLDVDLPRDIPLDDLGSLDELRQIGERLAAQLDWPAILSGADTTFRIDERHTHFTQYRRTVGR